MISSWRPLEGSFGMNVDMQQRFIHRGQIQHGVVLTWSAR